MKARQRVLVALTAGDKPSHHTQPKDWQPCFGQRPREPDTAARPACLAVGQSTAARRLAGDIGHQARAIRPP